VSRPLHVSERVQLAAAPLRPQRGSSHGARISWQPMLTREARRFSQVGAAIRMYCQRAAAFNAINAPQPCQMKTGTAAR